MNEQSFRASLGKYERLVNTAIKETQAADVLRRIWAKDAALWKSDQSHQSIIRNTLGWLIVAKEMLGVANDLSAFADDVAASGIKHVMVCGMGGSSLCPDVLRQTFGHQSGYPELLVLDSTDPDALVALGRYIDIQNCLFIIASKSGTTTEPLVFQKYWYDQEQRHKKTPGENFVAITDPGTVLVRMANDDGFRRVFLNQPDIGGRYSALTYFGMVPAALMGLDIKRFLQRASAQAGALGPAVAPAENVSAILGVVMAECAKAGRDKLTLVADPKLAALGLWIEQLIAESTGKEGKGIVPINGETLARPSLYGDDRLFVSIALGELDRQTAAALADLEAAGHPVVYLQLADLYDLGGHFVVWELATAIAGWRLGIDPFDQPNVQESKDATKELLENFTREGKLREQTKVSEQDGLTVYADERSAAGLPKTSVVDTLRAHLMKAKAGDYIALLDFVEETPEIEACIQDIRRYLRTATRCATTTGYGPRFLHSTGQLHKGGPNTGVFIQITATDATDLPIPGAPYSFSILKQAQALGDFRSLTAHGRRAIRVHLGSDVPAGLKQLREVIIKALSE